MELRVLSDRAQSILTIDSTWGAHWDCSGDQIQISTCSNPRKSPVAYVHPSKYVDYKLNNDLGTANRCIKLLADAGYSQNDIPHEVIAINSLL